MLKNKTKYIFLSYFVALVVFCGVRILGSFNIFLGLENLIGKWGASAISDVFFTVIIQVVVLFVIPFCLYKKLTKTKLKEVTNSSKIVKCNGKTLLYSVLIGVCVFLLNILLSSLFYAIIQMFGYSREIGTTAQSPEWYFVIDFILIAVMPAIFEEFLHRGLLLNNLKQIGYKKALIISSVFFGLMHLNIEQFFYATILGYIMGIVCLCSKSVWTAVIVHFLNNGIGTYLTYAGNYNWFGGNFYEIFSNLIFHDNFLIAILLIMVVLTLLLFLIMFSIFKISVINKTGIAESATQNKKVFDLIKNCKTEEEKKAILEFYEKNKQQNLEKNESENLESVNLENIKKATFLDLVLKDDEITEKLKLDNSIFLIATLFLGSLITIFTFIWGLF